MVIYVDFLGVQHVANVSVNSASCNPTWHPTRTSDVICASCVEKPFVIIIRPASNNHYCFALFPVFIY